MRFVVISVVFSAVTLYSGCGSSPSKPSFSKQVFDGGAGGDNNNDPPAQDGGDNPQGTVPNAVKCDDVPFTSVWQISGTGETIWLPIVADASDYNFTIDWGDGGETTRASSTGVQSASHAYVSSGIYTITIEEHVGDAWSFRKALTSEAQGKFYASGSITGSVSKLISVKNLGNVGWRSLHGAFEGASNLTTVAGGCTDEVNDMSYMFYGADSVDPDVSTWDFSAIAPLGFQDVFHYNSGGNCPLVSECFSPQNYDKLLKRLADIPDNGGLSDNVMGVSMNVQARYTTDAAVAKSKLENEHSFTITDKGQVL